MASVIPTETLWGDARQTAATAGRPTPGRARRPSSTGEDGAGMDVFEKVKSIIVDQLGVEESEVTPEASFVDDLGADSLDIVELVMAFEEQFGLEIPDEDAEKISTVADAVRYIQSRTE